MKGTFRTTLAGLVCLFWAGFSSAQGIEEAVRFSTQHLGGSTRSLGSANAIGAVGGSSTSGLINPAALALNRKTELGFGLNINSNGTQSTYIGSPAQGDINIGLGISNVDLAVNYKVRDYEGKPVTSGITNAVFAFGYNRHSDYRSSFTFAGNNTESSFTDFLAESANGNDFQFLNIYGLPYLAFETYLIENKTGIPDSFGSVIRSNNTNVKQTGVVTRTGSGGDFNLSGAIDIDNRFYLGAGLIIRKQVFKETLQFTEQDNQPLTDTNDYAGLTYTRFLETRTGGALANIGGLLKVNDNLRLGLSYMGPIRIRAKDLYTQSLTARYDRNRDPSIPDASYTRTTPDENLDGAPDTLNYSYRVVTPAKATFSIAYIIGKLGFLSLDVERVNLSTARLRPKDDPTYLFTDENSAIRTSYKPTYNIRVGGEMTYGKYRFRAGYAHQPSPYKEGSVSQIKPLNRNYYTLGVGYYQKKYSLNAALVITSFTDRYQPYKLELGRAFYAAEVKNSFTTIQFGATIVVD